MLQSAEQGTASQQFRTTRGQKRTSSYNRSGSVTEKSKVCTIETRPDGSSIRREETKSRTTIWRERVQLAISSYEIRFHQAQMTWLRSLKRPERRDAYGLDYFDDKHWTRCLQNHSQKWIEAKTCILGPKEESQTKPIPHFDWQKCHDSIKERRTWLLENLAVLSDDVCLLGVCKSFKFLLHLYLVAEHLQIDTVNWRNPKEILNIIQGKLPTSRLAFQQEALSQTMDFITRFCDGNFATLTNALLSAQVMKRSRDKATWPKFAKNLELKSIESDFRKNHHAQMFGARDVEDVFVIGVNYMDCSYELLLPQAEALDIFGDKVLQFADKTMIPLMFETTKKRVDDEPVEDFDGIQIPHRLIDEPEFAPLALEKRRMERLEQDPNLNLNPSQLRQATHAMKFLLHA